MRFSHSLAVVILGSCALWSLSAADVPGPEGRQELFDLSAKQTKLKLELEIVEKRLRELEQVEFAAFERVADPTGSDYFESISDTVLFATAKQDIVKGELLLYHAPGIYRVKDVKPKLTTKGECWYFRPNRDIKKGQQMTIAKVYDDPEEIALGTKGLAPVTDRARDPKRPYNTKITTRN